MKTPIVYYGGKQGMVRDILPLIPPHLLYCEPFFGGGAIFFAKGRSDVEVINDLNNFVINFYEQVQTNFEALQTKIQATLHARKLHQDAYVMYHYPHLFDATERAWAFWVLCNQGYAGQISQTWSYATADGKKSKALVNKRINFTEALKERLETVQIECNNALKIIERRDRETSFFYIDPPYFNADMAHYSGYTQQDFEDLLKMLSNLKGKFLLSSYPSEILTRYTEQSGWHTLTKEMTIHASSKGKRKIEVLTANYPLKST